MSVLSVVWIVLVILIIFNIITQAETIRITSNMIYDLVCI
jgi:hypothetical protein